MKGLNQLRSKKAIANIITALLLQIVSVICGLIVPRIIIATFSSSVNGLISSINQFLGFIILFEAGVGGVTRAALYKPLANKNTDSISRIIKATENFFRIVGLIFIGYLLLLSFLYPYTVSSDFDYAFTLSLVIIIGISTFVQYFYGMSYQILLGADQRQYFNTCLQIATIIINSILTIVLIYFNASIHVVKLGSAIVFIIRPIILYLYVNKKYNVIKNCIPDNNAIKQRWDGFGHHIAYLIRSNSDIVILTLLTNTIEVSVYSVYFMIVSGIQKIISTFSTGLEAAFGNILAKGENEKLEKNFSIFEFISYSSTTLLYTCTALLILPFIKIYTQSITDANYIRPEFAYFFIVGQALYCFRMPYHSLVLAAGHYKQTRNGAFVEAIINVFISIIFTYKFGLIGVAIGSLAAMFFRTVQYMLYLSKHILRKSALNLFKRFGVSLLNCIIILVIVKGISYPNVDTYTEWILYAVIVTVIAAFITLVTGIIFYMKDIKNLFNAIISVVYSKKKKYRDNNLNARDDVI